MENEILFFTAPWCGPCKSMKSMLNESTKKELNIKIIDITEDMELATKFEVMNVPMFIKTKNGLEVSRKLGSMTIQGLREF